MRIAIFGGSFDPIHHGHLILAQDALEQLRMDRVLFVPAAINPHKLASAPRASGRERLEMIRAAIAQEPRFSADPIELEREGPSYTVDTVEAIHSRWPDAELFLLIGEDNLPKLPLWERYEQLAQKVTFLTFGRSSETGPGHSAALPLQGKEMRRLERRIDISSTEIRERIAQGLSIQYLVPESVRLLIHTHGLYRNHSDQ